jgi:hypothetical protein
MNQIELATWTSRARWVITGQELDLIAVAGKEYEIIFDPIGKSAIVRNDDALFLLDGPFRTYAEAVKGAVAHLEKNESAGSASTKLNLAN